MFDPDNLPLVQHALHLLTERLEPRDRIAMVVYPGAGIQLAYRVAREQFVPGGINRVIEDFNDDAKDAGDLGAGHTVTALYEIVPAGARVARPPTDRLKYQRTVVDRGSRNAGELMTVALRFKRPEGDRSERIESVVEAEPASPRPSPSSDCC